jgi:hypothetical protein
MTRHNRDWWDRATAMRHAPAGGTNLFWRGFLLAFVVGMIVGSSLMAIVLTGGAL